jgi:hypothetical protein
MSTLKAGNVKQSIVKGKKYIIEFVSDSVGRAYRLEDGKKGAYVGKFTRKPLGVDENIAEANVKANSNTPEIPKNEKKVEEIAPPPKAAPLPKTAAVPKTTAPKDPASTMFHEKQQGLGCGRHALNNLLGEKAFKKGALSDKYVDPPGTKPISLLMICQEVSRILRGKGIREACLASENYDINTLAGALDYLGYEHEQFSPTAAIPEGGDFLGLLINRGIVGDTSKHWVALKKQKSVNGDPTVRYTLIDSLFAAPEPNITLADFQTRYGSHITMKVLLPKKEPFPLESRFVEFPNVVPEVAVPKKAAVPTQVDCATALQKCVLKDTDLPVLEAKVAELKAKQAPQEETKKGGSTRKQKQSSKSKTRKAH